MQISQILFIIITSNFRQKEKGREARKENLRTHEDDDEENVPLRQEFSALYGVEVEFSAIYGVEVDAAFCVKITNIADVKQWQFMFNLTKPIETAGSTLQFHVSSRGTWKDN